MISNAGLPPSAKPTGFLNFINNNAPDTKNSKALIDS